MGAQQRKESTMYHDKNKKDHPLHFTPEHFISLAYGRSRLRCIQFSDGEPEH